jgi:hypothetical protein
MSESDTELNTPNGEHSSNGDRESGWDQNSTTEDAGNDDIILDKDTMDCFLKFKAQQDLKKTRAEKKRLTKKGLPDKRAESSSKNVSKAREKVKEYLALSKSVVDDGDTDEEYIEVCVKKNPKKTKKVLTTKKVAPKPDGDYPNRERVEQGSLVAPPPVAPPQVRVEDSAIYKLMFGASNTTDLRAQLLRKK